MTAMTRRQALISGGMALGAAMGLGAGPGPGLGLGLGARAQGAAAPFLTSDIGTLRKVLVHTITPDEQPIGRWDDNLVPSAETDLPAAVRQQQALMELLRSAGAELIELSEALEATMEVTRPTGVFDTWLATAYPRLTDQAADISADAILGRDPATHYALREDGTFRFTTGDATSTMWTRDSAFMTPKGLVMGNAASRRRHQENILLRFLYRYSPMLTDYPVIFDAVQENLIIEGGDAMIVDQGTLLLGVGNRTDPRIAPVLARRLDMDVITVQTVEKAFMRKMPWAKTGPAGALRVLLLHLDTYFTHVGPRHGLILPQLMAKDRAEDNAMARFIKGARAETMMEADEAEAALKILKDFGKVTLYKAGSARKDSLDDLKLEDYLKGEGYRLTYTGGPLPKDEAEQFRHFMKITYKEQRRQATNVVQATPGRVIAYDGNPYTKKALEADGIAVDTFEARELWAWHGGPHCLTQPLERS